MKSYELYIIELATTSNKSQVVDNCQLTFIIDKSIDKSLFLTFCSQQKKTTTFRCFYIKSFYCFVLLLRFTISSTNRK